MTPSDPDWDALQAAVEGTVVLPGSSLAPLHQDRSQRVSVNMTRIAWCIRTVCTRAPPDWPKDASERKRVSIDATCCQRPRPHRGLQLRGVGRQELQMHHFRADRAQERL
jgi:hypothetical protein